LTRMFIVHKQLLAAGKAQNTDASNIITNWQSKPNANLHSWCPKATNEFILQQTRIQTLSTSTRFQC
jgi:hypothetical protein